MDMLWLILSITTMLLLGVVLILFYRHIHKTREYTQVLESQNQWISETCSRQMVESESLRREIHDFTNHLLVIRSLSANNRESQDYIDSLLKQHQNIYSPEHLCHSGYIIIDSLINQKKQQAKQLQTDFQYRIHLSDELFMKPIDISIVLGNQLDNALEATAKLPEQERAIMVELGEKGAFVFFRVMNTCISDPFDANGNLSSTKKTVPHITAYETPETGWGISNIQRTLAKYGGVLSSRYENHIFISTAMFQNHDHSE